MMYTTAKAIRLIQMSVAVTEGELALIVLWSPCTIHGCLPLSVSNQPAVFITNGVRTAQMDNHSKIRDRASVPLSSSQPPQSASSKTSDPRYAIVRIDQYWIATLGM